MYKRQLLNREIVMVSPAVSPGMPLPGGAVPPGWSAQVYAAILSKRSLDDIVRCHILLRQQSIALAAAEAYVAKGMEVPPKISAEYVRLSGELRPLTRYLRVAATGGVPDAGSRSDECSLLTVARRVLGQWEVSPSPGIVPGWAAQLAEKAYELAHETRVVVPATQEKEGEESLPKRRRVEATAVVIAARAISLTIEAAIPMRLAPEEFRAALHASVALCRKKAGGAVTPGQSDGAFEALEQKAGELIDKYAATWTAARHRNVGVELDTEMNR